MRIGQVIGTVTLNRMHPTLAGFRWTIAVPYSLDALKSMSEPDGEDLVVLDQLGAANGQRIGFTEGVEAAAPFHPERKPVDAYAACLLDHLTTDKR
jgi:ethanolamine utilization protein EutN